jgi:hypothetical protein
MSELKGRDNQFSQVSSQLSASEDNRLHHRNTLNNKYFICLNFSDSTPIPWSIYGKQPDDAPVYFTRVFRAMEKYLKVSGLTIYLTWKLDDIPQTGQNVVAVVLGDEWSRLPSYSNSILATFKTYGCYPQLDVSKSKVSHLNFLRFIKQVRTYLYYIPSIGHLLQRDLIDCFGQTRGTTFGAVYDCPLGYGNQIELPIQPIQSRAVDIFFAGSVEHTADKSGVRRWFSNPKVVARRSMLEGVKDLQRARPDISVNLALSSSFVLNALHYGENVEGEILQSDEYSKSMMNSKVCLVPRGTSVETFRFFEALRYGCVPITERLPSRWFYDGSPAYQIEDWSHLPTVASKLLEDRDALQRRHEAALRWWNKVCSPEAVGHFFASKINLHKNQR